jgi:hypothetical protein
MAADPDKRERREIFCPACEYRPQPEDRWDCLPRCGTLWHTFWTRGVCPGCGIHWPKTQCPSCGVLSPHEAWYHDPQGAPDEVETHELERSGD